MTDLKLRWLEREVPSGEGLVRVEKVLQQLVYNIHGYGRTVEWQDVPTETEEI